MTTVAFKSGIIACDSRMTQGNDIMSEYLPKIWQSKTHDAVYAGCGAIGQFYGAGVMLDQSEHLPWEDPIWRPSSEFDLDDATLMVVTFSGKIYYFEGKFWFPVEAPFTAMGSGSVAARAAMIAGASAEKAVEIACQLDSGSGLPVKTLALSDIIASKRKRKKRP